MHLRNIWDVKLAGLSSWLTMGKESGKGIKNEDLYYSVSDMNNWNI